MKIKQFDVVELNDNSKGIIKNKNKRRTYLVELISNKETKMITNKDIKNIIYSRTNKNRWY